MKILIGGSHGLVGTALVNSLEAAGHEISRLVRHYPNSSSEIEWSPDRYSIALARIEGFDAVVNLAGESIAEGRWTDEKKRRIRESRVNGTSVLATANSRIAAAMATKMSLKPVMSRNCSSSWIGRALWFSICARNPAAASALIAPAATASSISFWLYIVSSLNGQGVRLVC